MSEIALETGAVITGAGPAGMMLGLLLARAGIDATVVEKHEYFFQDFRGDTSDPATLDLLDQLGLHNGFMAIPPKQHHHTGPRGGRHPPDARQFRDPARCQQTDRTHAALGLF